MFNVESFTPKSQSPCSAFGGSWWVGQPVVGDGWSPAWLGSDGRVRRRNALRIAGMVPCVALQWRLGQRRWAWCGRLVRFQWSCVSPKSSLWTRKLLGGTFEWRRGKRGTDGVVAWSSYDGLFRRKKLHNKRVSCLEALGRGPWPVGGDHGGAGRSRRSPTPQNPAFLRSIPAQRAKADGPAGGGMASSRGSVLTAAFTAENPTPER